MGKVYIKKYHSGQEFNIHDLIKKVYDEFVAPDCTKEGNDFFYDWIGPAKIAERQKEHVNLWCAIIKSQISGMIEIRENKYVSLLFVDKKFHGKGIARQLFNEAVKNLKEIEPDLRSIYVHASLYSIPVYRKLGFVETGGIREENGIRYLPMEAEIK